MTSLTHQAVTRQTTVLRGTKTKLDRTNKPQPTGTRLPVFSVTVTPLTLSYNLPDYIFHSLICVLTGKARTN